MEIENFYDLIKQIGSVITTPLFEINESRISIMSFAMAIVFFLATLKVSSIAERYVWKLLSKQDLDRGIKNSIARFSKYLVLIIGSLVTLDTVGINLNSLAAIGAVLMVGVGFGLQNITQNFISGLILLLERPIKVGDMVTVGSQTGKVLEIGARSTQIKTRDDVVIIVPNSQFISEQVVNDSFSSETIRIHLTVGVAYGSDVELVRKILLEIAKDHAKVQNNPLPQVFFTDFGNSSLDFRLSIWVNDNWAKEFILSDLRYEVDKKFRENSVEIPFPQRDLHIKSGLSTNQHLS